MVMTNGNEVDGAAPTPVVVQPGPSAADLAAAFKAAGLIVQPAGAAAPVEQKKSRFDQLMERAKAAEDSDADTVRMWENVGASIKEDLRDEILNSGKVVSPNDIIRERASAAMEYINDHLESVFEDEEDKDTLVKLAKASLNEAVLDDTKYGALKEKIAQGSKEKRALKDLADEHANAIKKVMKREAKSSEGKGVSGIADGAGLSQAKVTKPGGGETSLESLSERQQDWYSSRRKSCLSVGMSEDEAHKQAIASALRIAK